MESCKNITIRLPCIAGFLCRAIFRGCAEIEIFGDIFTSGLRDRIREECTNYVLHNHHGLFMHQLLHLMSSKLAMNDQIVGHTEYKIHLRSDLGFYCPTSEFSVRSQYLVSDLRVYCPISEFYCPTWVFGSSNFSPTCPGGSVLIT